MSEQPRMRKIVITKYSAVPTFKEKMKNMQKMKRDAKKQLDACIAAGDQAKIDRARTIYVNITEMIAREKARAHLIK